jgi:anti-sigma28 factor (negative regulator of flagellin synthesis)
MEVAPTLPQSTGATEVRPASENDSKPPDPAIRTELVDRIRREIAAGTYDTPEKLEAALDRMLKRLAEE